MTPRLLTLGAALLLAPHAAHAAVDCEALLNSRAVTPYVQGVLDRVEDALGDIGASPPGSDDATETLIDAVRWAGAEIASTVDSYVQVTVQNAALESRTTCEEYDALLLQCSMENVRKKLNAAVAGGNFGAAYEYQNLYTFIHQRLRSLALGARDPRVQDATWAEPQTFDVLTDVWCCVGDDEGEENDGMCRKMTVETCREKGVGFSTLAGCGAFGCRVPDDAPADRGMVCPFSSDYLPPDGKGFGCDLSVLKTLSGYEGAERDRTVFERLLEQVRLFRSHMTDLTGLEQKIAALMGESPPPAAEPRGEDEEEEHHLVDGCAPGRCADNPDKTCTDNAACGGNDYCRRGWLRCENALSQDCRNDGDCESGACILMELPALTWELRGTFAAERDEHRLLEAFDDRRSREPREYADDLKLPGEEDPGDPAPRLGSLGERALRAVARARVREFARIQGREEAERFARGSDPIYRMAEVFQPVRGAGKSLAEIAQKPDGLRQVVIRFAWFLRRTCIDRVCNARLEWIMRVARTDSCFPYTDGTYLDQTCEEPLWKRCVRDAELEAVFPLPRLDCDE